MIRSIYSAKVLRYVHDQVTGEFVNLGVVLICPSRAYCSAKLATKSQRVTALFPGVRGRVLRGTLAALSRTFAKVSREWLRSHEGESRVVAADLLCDEVAELANKMVLHDDSAFQWSEPFTGITSQPATTFDDLFVRLVSRYEAHSEYSQRSDENIWSIFNRALENRGVRDRLQPHDIIANLETVKFKRALKNGRWHLLEPVSFDLQTPDAIKDKAKRILGQMTILKDSNVDFMLHFLVGEPRDEDVRDAYETALKILAKVPVANRIFSEAQTGEFAIEISRIADMQH